MQVSRPTFSAETELVRVNVLAHDRGKPLAGLHAGDFEIVDSGVPQQVDRLISVGASLEAWLVLDHSGSVKDAAVGLHHAAEAFVAEMTDADRVGLITFRHGVTIHCNLCPPKELSTLPLMSGEGFTSLRDAVSVALSLRDRRLDNAMILVLSDGVDTMSWTTEDQLNTAIGRSDAVVYAVAPQATDDGSGVNSLRRLTAQTGGRVIPLKSRLDLPSAFRQVIAEMKSRYLLSYYPTGVARQGWREIRVRLRNRAGELKFRQRYYVPRVIERRK